MSSLCAQRSLHSGEAGLHCGHMPALHHISTALQGDITCRKADITRAKRGFNPPTGGYHRPPKRAISPPLLFPATRPKKRSRCPKRATASLRKKHQASYLRRRRAARPAKASRLRVAVVGSGTINAATSSLVIALFQMPMLSISTLSILRPPPNTAPI